MLLKSIFSICVSCVSLLSLRVYCYCFQYERKHLKCNTWSNKKCLTINPTFVCMWSTRFPRREQIIPTAPECSFIFVTLFLVVMNRWHHCSTSADWLLRAAEALLKLLDPCELCEPESLFPRPSARHTHTASWELSVCVWRGWGGAAPLEVRLWWTGMMGKLDSRGNISS